MPNCTYVKVEKSYQEASIRGHSVHYEYSTLAGTPDTSFGHRGPLKGLLVDFSAYCLICTPVHEFLQAKKGKEEEGDEFW